MKKRKVKFVATVQGYDFTPWLLMEMKDGKQFFEKLPIPKK